MDASSAQTSEAKRSRGNRFSVALSARNHPGNAGRSILPGHLLGRFFLLAALLAGEYVPFAVAPHPTFHFVGYFSPFIIAWYAVFLALGYADFKAQTRELAFSVRFFVAHLACVLAVWLTDMADLRKFGPLGGSTWGRFILGVGLSLAIGFLALACIPLQDWIGVFRRTGLLWLYATLAGAFSCLLRLPMQSMWDASRFAPGRLLQVLTFHSVRAVLIHFLPAAYVDPDTFVIGTDRFGVVITQSCSGLEGIGLVLVFTTVWLWYFRKESRFPQALLLIPCALASVWILNVLRISALILIGNAGHGDVAMVGFHSQAGWIAFTSVAFAFCMATSKIAWVRKMPRRRAAPDSASEASASEALPAVSFATSVIETEGEESGESQAVRAYLVPFLAILAASFVSKAASAQFEWLYPLRFFAAAIALWHYRAELKQIDWRFGWLAPATGVGIFLVWLVPSFWTNHGQEDALGASLAALSPAARWSWIAFRVAAAAITVPIAEELAFRGYLARRLVGREFDSVPYSAITILSIVVSSAAFGLMHGRQWIVGTVAGLAFAGLAKWKGRLGDAIVAHAASNLLLAAWVVARGDWAQW